MKLKYYMRGVGIGILVTTIILVVAFACTHKISDEEVIERAKKLGMVEAEADTAKKASEPDNSDDANKTSEDNDDSQVTDTKSPNEDVSVAPSGDNNDASGERVVFTINSGESSRVVVERLYEYGLIDDSYSFNKYVNDKGVDNNLQPGTFYINKDISADDLVTLLVTKQQFRESP